LTTLLTSCANCLGILGASSSWSHKGFSRAVQGFRGLLYLQDEIFKEKNPVLGLFEPLFMFVTCISSIKNTFIVPTDAHYYKIVEMLKEFTILKL
jgi:hypothetical protein